MVMGSALPEKRSWSFRSEASHESRTHFSDQIQIRMCIFARVHIHANRIQRWLDPFSIPSRKVKILLIMFGSFSRNRAFALVKFRGQAVLGLGVVHAAWGLQAPRPIVWCGHDPTEEAGLRKLKKKLGGGDDTTQLAKKLPKLSGKQIQECFAPGFFQGQGVDMTKPDKEKGRDIKTIAKRLLGIDAEIPLDTQESVLGDSQDSQLSGAAPIGPPKVSVETLNPSVPGVDVGVPGVQKLLKAPEQCGLAPAPQAKLQKQLSVFFVSSGSAALPAKTVHQVGERGVAKKDDIWHDATIVGSSNGMWQVRDTLGKQWETNQFYQAAKACGETQWIQAALDRSSRRLVNLGAGRAADCWYLSVQAALEEFGQSFGAPVEFRKKLAEYCQQHVLPKYEANDQGRSLVTKALQRIEGGDMAESLEVKWTANMTGFVIFVYSQQYGLGSASSGVSHPMWSVIVPWELEHETVSSPTLLEKVNEKVLFLHSDGNTHYQAYLKSALVLPPGPHSNLETSGATSTSAVPIVDASSDKEVGVGH